MLPLCGMCKNGLLCGYDMLLDSTIESKSRVENIGGFLPSNLQGENMFQPELDEVNERKKSEVIVFLTSPLFV